MIFKRGTERSTSFLQNKCTLLNQFNANTNVLHSLRTRREVSQVAMQAVSAFAKQTGDLPALSMVDLQVSIPYLNIVRVVRVCWLQRVLGRASAVLYLYLLLCIFNLIHFLGPSFLRYDSKASSVHYPLYYCSLYYRFLHWHTCTMWKNMEKKACAQLRYKASLPLHLLHPPQPLIMSRLLVSKPIFHSWLGMTR